MPFTVQTFNKVVRKVYKQSERKLGREYAQLLNIAEIAREMQHFRERTRDVIAAKFTQNYSASFHFASGLLEKLYQSVADPFKSKHNKQKGYNSTAQLHSIQADSQFIHDYLRKWMQLTKEYKDLAKCAN